MMSSHAIGFGEVLQDLIPKSMTEVMNLLCASIGALVSEDPISCLDHVPIVICHQIEVAQV